MGSSVGDDDAMELCVERPGDALASKNSHEFSEKWLVGGMTLRVSLRLDEVSAASAFPDTYTSLI